MLASLLCCAVVLLPQEPPPQPAPQPAPVPAPAPTPVPEPAPAPPQAPAAQPKLLAVIGTTVVTVSGAPIANGTVLIRDGKIERVGPSAEIQLPADVQVVRAALVMPGLIAAHATAGLSGVLNIPHDQDQLERRAPIQPNLRAIDAFN